MKRVLLAFVLSAFAVTVHAAPIQYTYSGQMWGSLGGTDFSGAAFELNVNADTDGIWIWGGSEPGWPVYQNLAAAGSSTITIEGLGTSRFILGLILFARSGDPYPDSPVVGIVNPAAANDPFRLSRRWMR